MISIGRFSNIFKVTAKTLKHYEKIGLLRPAFINDENGYRFYDKEQINVLSSIIKLKQYNFSLDEIKKILEANNHDRLLEMLNSRKESIKEEMDKLRYLEKRIGLDINSVKQGEDIFKLDSKTIIKTSIREEILIASVRRKVKGDIELNKLYRDFYKIISDDGLTQMGNPMTFYHDTEVDEVEEVESDIEIGVEVDKKTKNTRVLNSTDVAYTIHKGAYETIQETYAIMIEWLIENDYDINGEFYEEYIAGLDSEKNENKLLTKIVFPIKKNIK